jgi:deazaflavin-dependent oxidoreductase (nitroreductase family)
VLVTTIGRRTGRARATVLDVAELQADTPVVIGGFARHEADWVRNLTADPRVHVVWGTVRFPATATVLAEPAAREVIDRYRCRRRRWVAVLGRTVPQLRVLSDPAAAARLVPVVAFTPREGHVPDYRPWQLRLQV